MSASEVGWAVACLMQFLVLVAVFYLARDERKEYVARLQAFESAHAHTLAAMHACQRELAFDEQVIATLTRQYGEMRQLSFMYSYGIHQNVTRLHEAQLAIMGARSADALALIRGAHDETLALLMTDPEKWGKPAPGTVA